MSNARAYLAVVITTTADTLRALGGSRKAAGESHAVLLTAIDRSHAASAAANGARDLLSNVLNAIHAAREVLGTETPQMLFGLADDAGDRVNDTLDAVAAAVNKMEEATVDLKRAHDALQRAISQTNRVHEEARVYQGKLQ